LREEDGEDEGRTARSSSRHNSRRLRTRYARDASPDTSEMEEVEDGPSTGQSNGIICQRSLAPVESDVEVVLEPLSPSHTWTNQKRYIKTCPTATIDHMVKYLSTRYRMEVTNAASSVKDSPQVDESLFTLYIPNGPGQFHPVQAKDTLGQIHQKWENKMQGNHLVLYYAYDIKSMVEEPKRSDMDDALPGPPAPSVHTNFKKK